MEYIISNLNRPHQRCDSLRSVHTCTDMRVANSAKSGGDLNMEINDNANRKYCFRLVDLCNLSQADKAVFIEHTNDFAAIKQMFGFIIACGFYCAFAFDDQFAYKLMIERYSQCKNNPQYRMFNWFVTLDDEFIGIVGMRTPQYHSMKFTQSGSAMELSGSIIEKYRGIGLVSKLSADFIEKLISTLRENANINPMPFIITCLPSNEPVKKIASKIGFKHFAKIIEPFDFVLFVMDTELDVYLFE